MNIKYRQLKAFTLAARTLSFTEAANELAVTQASFSSLIKELEHDLDLILFERTTRKCQLTEQGKVFYDSVSILIEHLETVYGVMKETGKGRGGILRISALPSIAQEFLPEVLATFKARFPNVEIILHERKNEDISSALKHKQVDVGFGSILKQDDTLEQHSLYSDHLDLIVPKEHCLSEKATITWEEVARYPHIMIGTGAAEYALLRNRREINIVVRVEHLLTAVALVRQGMGLTTLPSSTLTSMNMAGLKSILIDDEHATRDVGLMLLNEPIRSKVVENFVEFVLQHRKTKA